MCDIRDTIEISDIDICKSKKQWIFLIHKGIFFVDNAYQYNYRMNYMK